MAAAVKVLTALGVAGKSEASLTEQTNTRPSDRHFMSEEAVNTHHTVKRRFLHLWVLMLEAAREKTDLSPDLLKTPDGVQTIVSTLRRKTIHSEQGTRRDDRATDDRATDDRPTGDSVVETASDTSRFSAVADALTNLKIKTDDLEKALRQPHPFGTVNMGTAQNPTHVLYLPSVALFLVFDKKLERIDYPALGGARIIDVYNKRESLRHYYEQVVRSYGVAQLLIKHDTGLPQYLNRKREDDGRRPLLVPKQMVAELLVSSPGVRQGLFERLFAEDGWEDIEIKDDSGFDASLKFIERGKVGTIMVGGKITTDTSTTGKVWMVTTAIVEFEKVTDAREQDCLFYRSLP